MHSEHTSLVDDDTPDDPSSETARRREEAPVPCRSPPRERPADAALFVAQPSWPPPRSRRRARGSSRNHHQPREGGDDASAPRAKRPPGGAGRRPGGTDGAATASRRRRTPAVDARAGWRGGAARRLAVDGERAPRTAAAGARRGASRYSCGARARVVAARAENARAAQPSEAPRAVRRRRPCARRRGAGSASATVSRIAAVGARDEPAPPTSSPDRTWRTPTTMRFCP